MPFTSFFFFFFCFFTFLVQSISFSIFFSLLYPLSVQRQSFLLFILFLYQIIGSWVSQLKKCHHFGKMELNFSVYFLFFFSFPDRRRSTVYKRTSYKLGDYFKKIMIFTIKGTYWIFIQFYCIFIYLKFIFNITCFGYVILIYSLDEPVGFLSSIQWISVLKVVHDYTNAPILKEGERFLIAFHYYIKKSHD